MTRKPELKQADLPHVIRVKQFAEESGSQVRAL
jgi:hypothetical protein